MSKPTSRSAPESRVDELVHAIRVSVDAFGDGASDEEIQSGDEALTELVAHLRFAEQAVLVYEDAVKQACRHAPNHWHAYRDPFELSPAIRAARSLARTLSSRGYPVNESHRHSEEQLRDFTRERRSSRDLQDTLVASPVPEEQP